MLSKTCNDKEIDEVFEEVECLEMSELPNNNCLKIYVLPINNNKFNYLNMKCIIMDNIKSYVFSRKKINEYMEKGKNDRLVFEAITKFKEIKDNNDPGKGSELGEMLLYIFLESQLGARKILSKMELKTSRNDYVKGADGVFLHSYINKENKYFDFIIGEAKMYKDIKQAINEAFKSIEDHLKVEQFEYNLVNDNIFKEVVTEEEAEEIKKIIIPSHNKDEIVLRNDAFGIFLGYTLFTDSIDVTNKSFKDARNDIRNKILEDIKDIKNQISKKILQKGLQSYSFYIYILPFNDVTNDRENIMKEIIGEG